MNLQMAMAVIFNRLSERDKEAKETPRGSQFACLQSIDIFRAFDLDLLRQASRVHVYFNFN